MRRKDISIAITDEGVILAAQGKPAQDELEERKDIVDDEYDLYYSQLAHRAGWYVDGYYWLGYPSNIPEGAPSSIIGRPRERMTGYPVIVGIVERQ